MLLSNSIERTDHRYQPGIQLQAGSLSVRMGSPSCQETCSAANSTPDFFLHFVYGPISSFCVQLHVQAFSQAQIRLRKRYRLILLQRLHERQPVHAHKLKSSCLNRS